MDRRSFLRASALIVGDSGVSHLITTDETYAATHAAVNAGFVFEHVHAFRRATIPDYVRIIRLSGYNSPGDGGGHEKVRIAKPDVVMNWHDQSADGAWWETVAEFSNPRLLGANGSDRTIDTAAITSEIRRGGRAILPAGTYRIDARRIDLRLLQGPGLVDLSTGSQVVADALADRGGLAQRYITEVKNAGNNSATQSIAVHNGKLYRSQQNRIAENAYAYDSIVDITELELPFGDGRSRSTIDYTSDANSQLPNYTVALKGLGHGDGIAFLTEDDQTWLYGHCSAPAGSSDPESEANGYIKFPWHGASTEVEPTGARFYRNLQGVGNPNFGMSVDGRWLLFVQRDVDEFGIITAGRSSVTTYRVVVHSREAIESAIDHTTVRPFAKFVVVPDKLADAIYAQAGIASDGKYIYVTFSGARVIGRTWLYVYTLTGEFVKSVCTSGIRAENADVYLNGIGGWLPAFYETEGLAFHKDKLLTASRYLFVEGSPVVSWRGYNYVYIGNIPSAEKLPTNIAFWAPTMSPATHGNYNASTEYRRGTVLFHHYVTAYITGGVYGDEEFSIDVDAYTYPYIENSFNGMATSRSDYSICYNPLNTGWVVPTYTARTNGEHYFYNGEKLASGEHFSIQGAKLSFNGSDIALQHIQGLATSAALLLTNELNTTQPNSAILYVGNSSRGLLAGPGAVVTYGDLYPSANNTFSCGLATHRWTVISAETPAISTSDETMERFGVIEEAERAAALEIKANIRKYKLLDSIEKKGEDNARWHYGVAAQHVDLIMRNHGLNPHEYAFFCYDEWEATYDVWDEWHNVYDQNGKIITPAGRKLVAPARAAGCVYGIRYEELLCFILAAT
ncbi:hypothetical protein QO002_004507 [Pararhizobium capsulatum DSM 1112]|uniref:Peptidase S74 domain-containing protein n=1 Tax=Pararhizobium capsulatum DSM 1112 TaxID=1121113 RepID=A0ABU0BVL9_9HYPH|nr:tail fiber domain-containing protein [Pararhizobium capsulatum]MDQ0322301.1 hypothetical protein [Pararhizobium capsulatum DSM 1112]